MVGARQHWKQFFILFGAQCVSYGLLCWNYRAVAKAMISQTVLSDLLIAALSFKVLKEIMKDDAHNKSNLAWAGYVLGGATGSALSLWMTRAIWGN